MVFRTDLLGNPTRETNKNYVTSCSMWGQPLSKTWRKCHVQFSRSVPFGALLDIQSAGFKDLEALKNEDTEAGQNAAISRNSAEFVWGSWVEPEWLAGARTRRFYFRLMNQIDFLWSIGFHGFIGLTERSQHLKIALRQLQTLTGTRSNLMSFRTFSTKSLGR